MLLLVLVLLVLPLEVGIAAVWRRFHIVIVWALTGARRLYGKVD